MTTLKTSDAHPAPPAAGPVAASSIPSPGTHPRPVLLAVAAPGPFEREVRRRLASGRIDTPVGRRPGNVDHDPDLDLPEPTSAREEHDDSLGNIDPTAIGWPEPIDARRAGRRLVRRVRGARARDADADAWRVPMQVAVALSFARAVDGVPGLIRALRAGTPRVIVEVPDPLLFQILRGIWQTLLYGRDAGTLSVSPSSTYATRDDLAALTLVAAEAIKPKERAVREEMFLRALAVPSPIVCLVTDVEALPEAALRAAEHRLTLLPFDAGLVAATVGIVTGRHRRTAALVDDLVGIDCARLSLPDLAIAVRADRTPAACIAALRRLVHARPAGGGVGSGVGRDLTLDQLHGLRPAVDWARGALLDLEAWRAGAPWSSVASGAVIAGPPGTGKTQLAQAMARSGGIPLVAASLAQWQSADTCHLGTTLKAMRASFDEARAKARVHGGAILLIDEVDSFPDRNSVRHDYRDYVIEVQNALLELLDGATPREGVIVVGTTNAAARLDPALTRPGRLSRVIEVGYPDLDERVAMLRVRLGAELPDADLGPVARLTERATGAAIEELVAEARRRARREGRALCPDDLAAAVGGAAPAHPPGLLRRLAIHEAGHALVAALELGTKGLVVALQDRDGAGGWVETGRSPDSAGTRAEIEALIRVMLAGHAAETVLLGAPSAGAGGDLAQATKLAADLLGSWGLAGRERLLALGRASPAVILADPALRAEAGKLLALQHRLACALIGRRRAAVLAIAERLLAERRLDGAAVAALIGSGPPGEATWAGEEIGCPASRQGTGGSSDTTRSPDTAGSNRKGGCP